MKATAKFLHISQKKLNLVAGLVRKKKAVEAAATLKFTPKKAAKLLKKVIESAIHNAENNLKQSKDQLVVDEIVVTEGPTLKRFQPVSRGRSYPILKRMAHVTVRLTVAPEIAKKSKNVS